MIIFAFDTTTEYGSAGIFRGCECLASVTTAEYARMPKDITAPLDYSVVLFQMADRLLRVTDLRFDDIELFAVATGPGSFTGIRVGIAAAQAWGEVFSRPVLGVSVLEGISDEAQSESRWAVPIIDARRGEFYGAAFRSFRECEGTEPRKQPSKEHNPTEHPKDPTGEFKDRRSGSPMVSPQSPIFGFQFTASDFKQGLILNPAELKEFVSALRASGDVTCIAREHDSQAQALRHGLVCGGPILPERSPMAGDEDLGTLPKHEAADRTGAFLVRWQTIPETLVHAIGRLALRASREGRLQTPAELDALYIRRPDAEIRRKDD